MYKRQLDIIQSESIVYAIDMEGQTGFYKITTGNKLETWNPVSYTHLSIIAVNRNAMALVDVYDEDGVYMGQYTKQITLQHGYGDGMELSCERSVAAVSRLFYNLPISGYAAINMGAIPALNDAVGGVQVTVLDDVI